MKIRKKEEKKNRTFLLLSGNRLKREKREREREERGKREKREREREKEKERNGGRKERLSRTREVCRELCPREEHWTRHLWQGETRPSG